MLNNHIKAVLFRCSEMPWPDFLQLHAWMRRSADFKGFNFHTPDLKVAQAVNGWGKLIGYVCYTKAENAFVITGVAISSQATDEEVQRTSEVIDGLLEQQARLAGISKLLSMIPGEDRCEEIKTYTCKTVSPSVAIVEVGSNTTFKYIN